MQRNIGQAFRHSLLAVDNATRGLTALDVDAGAFAADLDRSWEVLGEAVQTVMRRHGLPQPYERLKELTRGRRVNETAVKEFVSGFGLPVEAEERLLALTRTPTPASPTPSSTTCRRHRRTTPTSDLTVLDGFVTSRHHCPAVRPDPGPRDFERTPMTRLPAALGRRLVPVLAAGTFLAAPAVLPAAGAAVDPPPGTTMEGHLDAASVEGSGIRVAGWALDLDTAEPIDIHVHVSGPGYRDVFDPPGQTLYARLDVAYAYPGYGPFHGFSDLVPYTRRGTHTVCAYAVNTPGTPGADRLLGCRQVTIG